MSIELANDKSHIVVKRNGTEEPYTESKMLSVLLWACEGNELLAKSIIDAAEIRIYNRIHIATLFDEMIDTAYNLISRLTPQYEPVAKRLYLQKMYKELWGIKRSEYPTMHEYLPIFINSGTLINVFDYMSTEEIQQLTDAIKPERDLLSSYLGMKTYFSKYSLRHNKKPKELLQHGFMRMAIQAYLHDESPERVSKMIHRYDNLSLGLYTEATPKFKNSLRTSFSGASCCIHKVEDNTESINKVVSDIGQYSRSDGGNAVDISSIRSNGSTISTKGFSSGTVPVVRHIQSDVELFNQSSTRPGACAVYYPWWHADIMQLLPLLDEGGKENQRARSLKYAIKIDRLFLRAIESESEIYLFDPKKVPEFNELVGVEFDAAYSRAVASKLYEQVIPAQIVAYELAKQRLETGNVYIFFRDNVMEQSVFKSTIHSSNLCTEILLPTEAATKFRTKALENISTGTIETHTTEVSGLTALCNLSSINVLKWYHMTDSERHIVARELLEASDNIIDYQHYPTPDGEIVNRNYRAIGIGQNNTAQLFATLGLKYSDSKSLIVSSDIARTMYEVFTYESAELAKLRGNFKWIHKTKRTSYARFATLFAIAPTATSSLIIDATEGIEPISSLLSEKTGTSSSKQLAPQLQTLGVNYELAGTIPTEVLYKHAQARNQYLDQGQSINTYAKDVTSAAEVINDIILAESLKLTALYYLQSNTSLDGCDSCSS